MPKAIVYNARILYNLVLKETNMTSICITFTAMFAMGTQSEIICILQNYAPRVLNPDTSRYDRCETYAFNCVALCQMMNLRKDLTFGVLFDQEVMAHLEMKQ